MIPLHSTNIPRIAEGPAHLDAWDRASLAGAANAIKVIAALLMQHEIDRDCEPHDDLLRLNGAAVAGLLEAINGLTELIEMRLRDGSRRAKGLQP
ncbi:hypothetical protein SAMN04489707_106710 [Paenacidovorax caeni]|uniref:Uncharacterized protein n=1 Tax=Paenacidovorax caeni TaxID=343013 RepID=A0A1I7KRD6_9BURK|nr:hypothetical protein [Paenacidovorax caeni]SFV00012.1 hypothetical protein SAMN04489707_106710 [Paenacidovorax caeni]